MEEFFIFTRDKDLCDEEGGSFTKVGEKGCWGACTRASKDRECGYTTTRSGGVTKSVLLYLICLMVFHKTKGGLW